MNGFNDLKIKWKMMLGSGLPILFLIGISISMSSTLKQLLQSSKWVNHTHEAIAIGTGITESLINMETGFRGFMVVGDENFLEPFYAGSKAFDQLVKDAKEHVSDNGIQVSRIEQVISLRNDWLEKHVDVAIDIREDVNDGRRSLSDVSSFIERGIGKQYMDEMRVVINEFIAAEQVLIGTRNEDQKASAASANIILLYGSGLAILLSVIISLFIIKRLLGSISSLINAIDAVEKNGDFSVDFRGDSKDEIGNAMDAFGDFITAINKTIVDVNESTTQFISGNMEKRVTVEVTGDFSRIKDSTNEFMDSVEKASVASRENSVIRGALDVADAPVMIADADLTITYVNQSASKMIEVRGDTLRTLLPSLDHHKLVGSNVDQFHKNPSHQRNLLSELSKTYHSQIKVAGLTFRLTATPLFDDDKTRLGTVIEWNDRTEELAKALESEKISQENASIKQALDNVSTNTMIADSDRKIIYMNKSVADMLKSRESKIRGALPNFNADELIGANMDSFHRNPTHQRDLLGSLTSTYRAQIQIADLHFGLIASPVYDDAGGRIGTVVEWDDRTEQVNIQAEIDKLITSASHGDLSRRIEEAGKEGFFATLSQGLNQLVEISEGVVSDTARVFSALSHGNLTESIEKHYDGAFGELKNDANATVSKLTEIITQIREASSTVSTGADEIAQGNADLSQRTEEQASSLEETASSMEQMTSAVKSSADNAMQANEIAGQTQKLASSGGAVVQDAVRAMGEINESSKHIADIIGVIDEIAFQTNLLALNAAVEAARAGEQGRGFAVVASEVRNLAQRSAGAAKEIKDLIRDSVDKVTTGSQLVNKSGETLEDIVNSVQKVSSMVSDISGSAHEQSSGIEQVNKAVSQMDEMTQQNAALVEEATAAGEAMAEQARKLMQQMAFFTLSHDTEHKNVQESNVSASASGSHVPVNTPSVQSSNQGGAEVSDDDSDWEEF